MSGQSAAGTIVRLDGETTEARLAALEQIFNDTHAVACMEASLKNTDNAPNEEQIKKRRLAALDAFSRNPAEFWDMKSEYSGNE